MNPERFNDHTVWAFVCGETFDPLVDRVTKLLSHDRRIVLTRRYVGRGEAERGTYDMDVKVGLKLDPRGGDPINVTSSGFPEPARFLNVLLSGASSFGFGAPTALTETDASRLYVKREGEYGNDVAHVTITGRGEEPSREDRIDIETWNENRVGQITTVVFQADWDY